MAHKSQRKDIARLNARVASFLRRANHTKPAHNALPNPPHHVHHHMPAHNTQPSHVPHHKALLPAHHHTTSHMKSKPLKKKTHHHARTLNTSPRQITFGDQRTIAENFAASVHKRFDALIKATVLFGSQAKHTATSTSDIDIVILVDDVSINWDLELIAWYREELGKLIANNKHAHELHVNTIKLSTWWQDLLHGDPVVLNIIRYGESLIDIAGFFKPLKVLLFEGKIHSTPEAVYSALQRAPQHLARSHQTKLSAIEGVYWTMVDAAQAALITAGQLPPSPEHITAMLKEQFVDRGFMKMDFVYWYRDCFALHKGVLHGTILTVKGADIDAWQQRAEEFMKKMTEIIDHLLSSK